MSSNSALHRTDALPSHRRIPQAVELRRRQRDSPSNFDLIQPSISENSPSSTDVFQSEVTDDSTTVTDDFVSDFFNTVPVTDDEPSSTRRSLSPTALTTVSTTTLSQTPTGRTRTMSDISRSTSAASPSATASRSPVPTTKSFRMTAASIAATVVLCCFVSGGAAIMLYYRIRRFLAWRGRQQQGSFDSDGSQGAEGKSVGDSPGPSTITARESLMYHPEHRDSRSTVTLVKHELKESVAEREHPYDYRVEHNDIPMSEIEQSHYAEHSPVSPLLPPTLPRPISNVGRKGERQSLRREFSFDEKEERPSVPSKDPGLNRRSALTSNPPSDWPLVMPNYYGRGFPSHQDRDLALTGNRQNSGWRSVAQRPSFEEVQIRSR